MAPGETADSRPMAGSVHESLEHLITEETRKL